MRDELEHVLAYAHIAARLVSRGLTAIQVLAHYDSKIQRVEAATRCNAICKDPDDQIFIDLAVQHGALLVSKDKAILILKKKMTAHGAVALTAREFEG